MVIRILNERINFKTAKFILSAYINVFKTVIDINVRALKNENDILILL